MTLNCKKTLTTFQLISTLGPHGKARQQLSLAWAQLARHVNATFSFDPQAIENLRLLAEGPCPDCRDAMGAHTTSYDH